MPVLTQIEKKIRMNQLDIIKFQLIVHCYLKGIHISENDLSCLTLLGMAGQQTLEDFCTIACNNKIFSSNQSARNALAKAEKKDLIVKIGKNRKKISLNPELKIQIDGNILLDYKIMRLEAVPHLEPQEI